MINNHCPEHGGNAKPKECSACKAYEVVRQNSEDVRKAEHFELSRSPTPANYISLQAVLDRAFKQAAYGKGKDRHAKGQAFEEQPIVKLQELYGTGYAFGQVGKKTEESQRMALEPAVAELLGAINYLAAAIIHLEKSNG